MFGNVSRSVTLDGLYWDICAMLATFNMFSAAFVLYLDNIYMKLGENMGLKSGWLGG